MTLYKDYISFNILGAKISIVSDVLDIGINTVAMVGSFRYYLGHEQPTIAAAMLTWQFLNDRTLTDFEFKQVLRDNNL